MSDLKLSKIQMSEAVEYNDALEHNKLSICQYSLY